MSDRYKHRNYNALSLLLGSDFSESIKNNDDIKKFKDTIENRNYTPEEKQQLMLTFSKDGPSAAAEMSEYLQGKMTEKQGIDALRTLDQKLKLSQAVASDTPGIMAKLEQEAARDPEALKRFQESGALQEHLRMKKPANQIFQEEIYSKGLGGVPQVKDYMKNAQDIEKQMGESQQNELLSKRLGQFFTQQTEKFPTRSALGNIFANTGKYEEAIGQAQAIPNNEYGQEIVNKQMGDKTGGLSEKDKLNMSFKERQLAQQKEIAMARLSQQGAIAKEKLDVAKNISDPDVKELKLREIIDKVDIIRSHPGFTGAVGLKSAGSGFGLIKNPIAGTPEADFVAQFDGLKNLLTLDNLGLMKGVLSNTDIEILKSAATTLSTSNSEQGFSKELDRIMQKAYAGLAKLDELRNTESTQNSTVPQSKPKSTQSTTQPKKYGKIGRFTVEVE
ncbi:MAG: hypothetical protein EHM12_11135 [Dehalococcoidia bacterium]|nr:MAG: hypothetical protein EHM12_11135 [Dehalococcoidia bacterium]